VDERKCSLRMKGDFNHFPVISIYTLAPEENELVKDSFNDKLNQIYQRIPAHDTKIIVGYFNAKIGRKKFLSQLQGTGNCMKYKMNMKPEQLILPLIII
jgi:hypothetical protein